MKFFIIIFFLYTTNFINATWFDDFSGVRVKNIYDVDTEVIEIRSSINHVMTRMKGNKKKGIEPLEIFLKDSKDVERKAKLFSKQNKKMTSWSYIKSMPFMIKEGINTKLS